MLKLKLLSWCNFHHIEVYFPKWEPKHQVMLENCMKTGVLHYIGTTTVMFFSKVKSTVTRQQRLSGRFCLLLNKFGSS